MSQYADECGEAHANCGGPVKAKSKSQMSVKSLSDRPAAWMVRCMDGAL